MTEYRCRASRLLQAIATAGGFAAALLVLAVLLLIGWQEAPANRHSAAWLAIGAAIGLLSGGVELIGRAHRAACEDRAAREGEINTEERTRP